MNDKATENRRIYMREYMREYRKKNREKINAQKREWNKNNPDKLKEYQERYWEKQEQQEEVNQ